jgi:hypothetical protein
MQRIGTLLKKIHELYSLNDKATALEIDLMMDYTRVMYADMLEWRNRTGFNATLIPEPDQKPIELRESSVEPLTQKNVNIETRAQTIELSVPAIDEQTETTKTSEGNNSTITPQFVRRDIRKYISINDKYLYTSELFGGNTDAYERALDEINSQNTYNEAIEWLDENVNFEYSWEEENEIVQSFYQLLSQFFASK